MNMVVSHWSANAAALAGCLLAAAVHLAGLRGLQTDARRAGCPRPPGLAREAIAFYAGLAVILLAVVSPLGYYAGTFIWVRALQILLLGVVAPPLIVLGAPWLVLARGLGRAGPRPGPAAAGAERPAAAPEAERPAAAPDAGRPRLIGWPVAVTALFNLVWCAWWLPALFDPGVRHPWVLAVQAISYLAVGVLFWLQLIGSRPLHPALPPLQRVMLIAATVLCGTILGMVLGFGASAIYPAYRGVGHHRLLTIAGDQQLAGAELWVLMLLPYVIAGVSLLIRWLNEEESQALTLGLTRMLRPSKSAWPARTGWR
jgi:putative membrane protein